jgi:membrane-associated protease RseP (regulator of RpoE activity)
MRFSGDVWAPVAAGSVGGAMTVTEKDALADVPALEQEVPVESGNFNRVLQLIAGLAVITALFILLGWGDILLFIAILIAIVMLHELGHFVTAKRAGMKVTEYFVGFGPRLWSVRRGETEYGVKAIPAGGYVRITGFTSTEEVAEEDEPRAYRAQPFHQRIIVASAGSVMHLIIAFVLAMVLVLGFGVASNNYKVTSLEHWSNGAQTPAQLVGLKAGDTIVSINGKAFANSNSMEHIIGDSVGKSLTLGVERDGHLIHVAVTPSSGKGIKVDGQKLADHGYIGVGIESANASVSLLSSPGKALSSMWEVTTAEVAGIGHLFSPTGVGSVYDQVTNSQDARNAANNPDNNPRPVSVIGITNLGAQAAKDGLAPLLVLLITINIVFAILNMLPMVPLDGGHVAIATYEWIRTRKGDAYYRADITKLFPLAILFVGILAAFVLAGIYLDITHPLHIP